MRWHRGTYRGVCSGAKAWVGLQHARGLPASLHSRPAGYVPSPCLGLLVAMLAAHRSSYENLALELTMTATTTNSCRALIAEV